MVVATSFDPDPAVRYREQANWPTGGENRPVIIGIAGGSGSGKTTIAKSVVAAVGAATVALIQHDAYYRDLPYLDLQQRARVNYDHPDSLETELLIEHINQLRAGRAIERPVYDFTIHRRTNDTVLVPPDPVVIIEGILVLSERELRDVMDLRIYVDAAADLRFIRRLQRDIYERERTLESVIAQYQETVRPMHLQFVEPSKRYADIIVPNGEYSPGAVGTIISMIRDVLSVSLDGLGTRDRSAPQ
jgi:uridine kinase